MALAETDKYHNLRRWIRLAGDLSHMPKLVEEEEPGRKKQFQPAEAPFHFNTNIPPGLAKILLGFYPGNLQDPENPDDPENMKRSIVEFYVKWLRRKFQNQAEMVAAVPTYPPMLVSRITEAEAKKLQDCFRNSDGAIFSSGKFRIFNDDDIYLYDLEKDHEYRRRTLIEACRRCALAGGILLPGVNTYGQKFDVLEVVPRVIAYDNPYAHVSYRNLTKWQRSFYWDAETQETEGRIIELFAKVDRADLPAGYKPYLLDNNPPQAALPQKLAAFPIGA